MSNKVRVISVSILTVISLGLVYYLNTSLSLAQTSPTPPLSPRNYGYFTHQGPYGASITERAVLGTGLLNTVVLTSDPDVVSKSMNPANWGYGDPSIAGDKDLTNKEGFIQFIESKYNPANPGGSRDSVGAAFIIQNMRGVASPNGEANYPTPSEVDDWKARIRGSSVELSVVRDNVYNLNSAYMQSVTRTENASTHCDTTDGSNCDPDPPSGTGWSTLGPRNCQDLGPIRRCVQSWTRTVTTNINDVMFFDNTATLPTLVFKQNGIPKVKIKINCGNMLGTVGLENIPELDWNYDIDLRSSPATTTTWVGGRPLVRVRQGQNIDLVSTVTNTGRDTGPNYAHIIRPISDLNNDRATEDLIKLDATADTGWIYGGTYPTSMGYKWDPLGALGGGGSRRIMTGRYRVKNTATIGDVMCFYARVAPTNPAASPNRKDVPAAGQVCIEVIAGPVWDYTVDTKLDKTTAAPGDAIKVTNTVNNVDTAFGDPFGRRIVVTSGSTLVDFDAGSAVNSYWVDSSGLSATKWGNAGLTGGSSSSEDATYTVKADAVGTVCFEARVFTNRDKWESGSEECVDIVRNTYDYDPSITIVGTAHPGDTLTIEGPIKNNGTAGTGAEYLEKIYVWQGMDQLVSSEEASWSHEPGLSAGATSSPVRKKTYTIKNDATNGAWICFSTWVNPDTGLATPGAVTQPNRADIADACIQVDNLQYNLDVSISGVDIVVTPGQTINDIKYNVCNTDTLPVGASRGSAPNVGISITGDMTKNNNNWPNTNIGPGAGNCIVESGSFDVPNTATVGQQYCTTLSADKDSGYTSGGIISPGPISTESCVTVGVTPYLQVQNGDIWAGANFDSGTNFPVEASCNPNSPGADPHVDSEIRSVTSDLSSLWKGSFVEYASFSLGFTSNFGSGNSAGPGYQMTFANSNSPIYGNYTTETACIPNYFGLLVGAEDGSANNSTAININSGTYRNGNQYFSDGDLTINAVSGGAGLDFDKSLTFVVNGNVNIKANGANSTLDYDTNYGNSDSLNVPSLVIVASGNIYIDEDITQVDAILISQGDEGVWTCSDGFSPVDNVADGKCYKPLTINGAIIANRINFMRTHENSAENLTGGVHDGSSIPSEVINFQPEFFLSSPVFKSNFFQEDELRTLLFKDLPPVY